MVTLFPASNIFFTTFKAPLTIFSSLFRLCVPPGPKASDKYSRFCGHISFPVLIIAA